MEVEILNTAEINKDTKEQGLVFAKFTNEESGVYGILCTRTSVYEKKQILESNEIPSRIKDIVEKTGDRFHKFEIWESENYEIKDPIILGRERDPGYPTSDWSDRRYFIGRWGKELANFSVLKQQALVILEKRVKKELLKIKGEVDTRLLDVNLFASESLDRGDTSLPYLSLGLLQ